MLFDPSEFIQAAGVALAAGIALGGLIVVVGLFRRY
jgi:hypothetical protein